MQAFGTEQNLNPPSNNNVVEQPKTGEQSVLPQNQSSEVKRSSTYRRSVNVKNNYPQQSGVSNFNNPNQNLQQNSSEPQNSSIAEQTQQNTEKIEEVKKEKKESSKNIGEFSATYPEKFKWKESEELKDSEDEEDTETIEDKDSKPKDLPDAKDEEIVLPEVIAATETKSESSVSLFAGIVAWACILTGIGIILFILFMNKKGGEFPVDSEKTKKKRKSSRKKYYKGNF